MEKCTKHELYTINGGGLIIIHLFIIGCGIVLVKKYYDYKRGRLKYFRIKG